MNWKITEGYTLSFGDEESALIVARELLKANYIIQLGNDTHTFYITVYELE